MCRRCHEVFAVTEEEIEDREDSLKSASERAEEFLESLRADREKKLEGYRIERGLSSVSEEGLETPSEPEAPAETLQDATAEPETSATREFEEFYANLKVKQQEKAKTPGTRHAIPVQQKKSPARKAIVWVVLAVVIWLVMIIICSLR